MPVTAKLRHLRIAPRKVRLVADLIRGKSVKEAQDILHFAVKRAALPFLKLLKSVVSNAENNFQLEEKELYISKVLVDEGPRLKRWLARARGKANEIQKKTSHITMVLDEFIKKPKEVKKEEVEKLKKVERVEEYSKIKEAPKEGKPPAPAVEQSPPRGKVGQAKFRPRVEMPKPKKERGLKKLFKRTAF